jgi:hypothetical protein
MAFTFVVETGEGLPTATSYISVEEATDYFEPDQTATATWTAFTQAEQEYYLAWASRLLDQKCEYHGVPTSEVQGLRWPRTGARNRDGQVISGFIIPVPIKQATCELAKYLFNGADITTGPDVQQLSKIKVDVIEIEWQADTAQVEFPSIINAILRGLGYLRAGAMGAARIIRTG